MTRPLQDNSRLERRPSGISRLAIYIAFSIGLLHLLFFHVAPSAPWRLRAESSPRSPLASLAAQLNHPELKVWNGELRIADPPALRASNAMRLTRAYFTAAYTLYPGRVFVGYDDQIINNEKQLLAADAMPSREWLHAHAVKNIYDLTGGAGSINPQIRIHPAP